MQIARKISRQNISKSQIISQIYNEKWKTPTYRTILRLIEIKNTR